MNTYCFSNILKNYIIVLFIALSTMSQANVRLPKLLSDGMVLQRNVPVKIWGWADAGEKISLTFNGHTIITNANNDGSWQIVLPEMEAGGPYVLNIRGNNEITVRDILVGEVWVLSGQSQMDQTMDRVSPLYPDEIKNAGNNNIRYFEAPVVYNFKGEQNDFLRGEWQSIGSDNIRKIAAISYFFASELFETYKIPVGIIRSSVGGSPAQAWIGENALQSFPDYYAEAIQFRNDALIDSIENADRELAGQWYAELNQTDKAYTSNLLWKNPSFDDSQWSKMYVPGYWADGELGQVNGAVWFRKKFALENQHAGKKAKLNMGTIVDADSVFINGIFVGSTGYQYPPRRYTVPEGVLQAGDNTIVVRVISNAGKGGFVPDKPYRLIVENDVIDLKGEWKYALGAKMDETPAQTFVRWKPMGLFNAMIAPLTNYSMRGVLWYQGESNTEKPDEYSDLMKALIMSWRNAWNCGSFPFIFAQLHNFMQSYDYPTHSNWALTREQQLKSLEVDNTAMIVTIDLGEWNDIHPLNKKDVAKRFALAARKLAYHENDVVASGPILQSFKIDKNKVLLTFSDVADSLVVYKGNQLNEFAIAGKDQKFVWAQARIVNKNTVEVTSPRVLNPVAVRYAWANNPDSANLYNSAHLPASPFRTDEWECSENEQ